VNDEGRNATNVYLQVMPQFDGDPRARRWHVFKVRDESPRITLAGSVASCDEARKLASRDKCPLRIAERAWLQMVAAGVAPTRTPNDVTVA
jgi:hypothetical protein